MPDFKKCRRWILHLFLLFCQGAALEDCDKSTALRVYSINAGTMLYLKQFTSTSGANVSVVPMKGDVGKNGFCNIFDVDGQLIGTYKGDGLGTGVLRSSGTSLNVSCSLGKNFNGFSLKLSVAYSRQSVGLKSSSLPQTIGLAGSLSDYPQFLSKEWVIHSDTRCDFFFMFLDLHLKDNCDLVLIHSDDYLAPANRWSGQRARFNFSTTGHKAYVQLQTYALNPLDFRSQQGESMPLGFRVSARAECLKWTTEKSCSQTVRIKLGEEDMRKLNATVNDVLRVGQNPSGFDNYERCKTKPGKTEFLFNLTSCEALFERKAGNMFITYQIGRVGANIMNNYNHLVTITCEYDVNDFFAFTKNDPDIGDYFSPMGEPNKLDISFQVGNSATGVNPVALVNEKLLMKIQLPDVPEDVDNVIVQIASCWAAENNESNSEIVHIIGCKGNNTGRRRANVTRNGQARFATFELRAFEWNQQCSHSQFLYIHCRIIICNNQVERACPLKMCAGTSYEGVVRHHNVSLVPITVVRNKFSNCKESQDYCTDICKNHAIGVSCFCYSNRTLSENCQSCTSSSTSTEATSMLVVGYVLGTLLAVVLLVSVTGAVLLIKKQRKWCFAETLDVSSDQKELNHCD